MSNKASMFTVFESAAALETAALQRTKAVLESATDQAPVHFVLAGGSTPKGLYGRLSQETETDWSSVHIWFGDERTVGPAHDESNYKMATEALLNHVNVPASNVHRMRGEDSPADAAAAYAADIDAVVPKNDDGLPVFDLILLGMGDDGHTASLFPGTDALRETERTVVANEVPQLDTVRITLTFPTINAAKSVMFLVAGSSKATALAQVAGGGIGAPPSAAVQLADGALHWLVDAAAASELR